MVLTARLFGDQEAVGDEAALAVNKTIWPNTSDLDWCSEHEPEE